MSTYYNDYVSKVQSRVKERAQNALLSSSFSIVSELKTLAEENRNDLTQFKGISSELSSSLTKSVNDVDRLNDLLNHAKGGFSKLPNLKADIKKLNAYPTASTPTFNFRVNALVNNVYKQMTMRGIEHKQEEIYELIEEMKQFDMNEKLRKERKQKEIRSTIITIVVSILAIYLIIAFVVPFLMAWWWAVLLAIVGIGWVISKFSD
jgi:cation transport ATPase